MRDGYKFFCSTGDSIVVIRASSRVEPAGSSGQLALSFSKGVVFEKNAAAAGLERLRKVCASVNGASRMV